MSVSLATISQAKNQLSQAKGLGDILEIRDKAQAIQTYVKAIGESLEAQNHAAEIKLRAERAAGDMLAGMEKNKGAATRSQDGTASLEDIGINKNQSSRWQKEASVPEEKFEEWVAEANEAGKELTQSGLLGLAKAAHVSQAVGENEWYTPEVYIQAASAAMNGIDLDPASNEIAQRTIKAGAYYTIADDGLSRPWYGNVWLNPPYSKDLIHRFITRLVAGYQADEIAQAVLLVNNASETKWFQQVASVCSAICLPSGRIKFESPDREKQTRRCRGKCLYTWGRIAKDSWSHSRSSA